MGDFFWLRGYFREVWILVANIVYIIFALILLYMAIMQIFGWAESEYAFKKKLPSFLVGILLVPFTWLIVSWTLSFANQAVAAVLSIPMGTIDSLDTWNTWEQDQSLWHKKVLPTQFDFSTNESGYGSAVKCENGTLENNQKVRCISPAEFLTENQAGPFFIIMIYAYNIFKIQEADLQPLKNFCTTETSSGTTQYQSAKSCVENLMGILRDFGLSLIVTVFFAIMLIALCWVLLMRAIKLWIYIMLSPLFGLAYFTGQWMGETVWKGWESGFGEVGFKAFFKLAMVPVLVSAVLAFWILFVGVVRDNFHGGLEEKNQTEFCTQEWVGYMVTYCITKSGTDTDPVYTSKLIIGTDITSNDGEDSRITLNFWDSFSKIIDSSTATSIATGSAAGAISSVEDIFAHIILTMMALVFMFMGVKVAANYDPVTEAAFKPFAQLGESVGNFVAHSPSYLPLPHPAFAALTPSGMKWLATAINTKVSQEEAKIGRTMQEMLWDRSLMWLKASLDSNSGSVDDLNQKVRQLNERGEKILQTTTVASSIPHVIGEIQKFAEEGGVAMTEQQKRQLQSITDTSTAQEFFSNNTELLRSMQDFYKSKDAADVSKFLQTIANTTSVGGKQINWKDLVVERDGNRLQFKIGESNAFRIGSDGKIIDWVVVDSTQKTWFQDLLRKSWVSYSEDMSPSDVNTALKNAFWIQEETLVWMNDTARKELLKTLTQ